VEGAGHVFSAMRLSHWLPSPPNLFGGVGVGGEGEITRPGRRPWTHRYARHRDHFTLRRGVATFHLTDSAAHTWRIVPPMLSEMRL
jgi:hypothetical protein